MATFLLIYGSTSGNTEIVFEKVTEILRAHNHTATLKRAEESQPQDMLSDDHEYCILGSSTYGHGVLQDYMIPFERELKNVDLNGKKCAVIGLGDDKYDTDYNVEAAPILERAIEKANGKLITESLKINKSPIPQLEGKVTDWANSLISLIENQ